MTRLLEPDIGEVLDRISILELKIEFGSQKSVSTEAWEKEFNELEQYLTKKVQSFQQTATAQSTDDWMQLNAELKLINRKLWGAEDEIRALRKTYYTHTGEDQSENSLQIADVAIRIADLNDARISCIQKVNAVFGSTQQEKIYNVQ